MSTHIAPQGPRRIESTPSNGVGRSAEHVGGGEEINVILDAIKSTKFGEVTVIVQDGYIVQVNRLEKRRLR